MKKEVMNSPVNAQRVIFSFRYLVSLLNLKLCPLASNEPHQSGKVERLLCCDEHWLGNQKTLILASATFCISCAVLVPLFSALILTVLIKKRRGLITLALLI